jgi:hypothetical protein
VPSDVLHYHDRLRDPNPHVNYCAGSESLEVDVPSYDLHRDDKSDDLIQHDPPYGYAEV